jgi:hypothetical protein
MGSLLEKDDNWIEFSQKLKILASAIHGYAKRVSSQAKRQQSLITQAEPARNAETTSNVTLVEVMPFHLVLPASLRVLNK